MRKELFDRLSAESEAQEKTAGRSMASIVALPDSLRQLVNWMMHQQEVRLAEVAAHTGQEEEAVRTMLDTLVEQGFVRETDVAGESHYRIRPPQTGTPAFSGHLASPGCVSAGGIPGAGRHL